MAFVHVFIPGLAVTVGNPVKASDVNKAYTNEYALRERFVLNTHFNNTGVAGEDGYFKADRTAPSWFYAKTGGATTKYFCFHLDSRTGDRIRLHLSTSTAAPTAGQGYVVQMALPEAGAPAGLP